MIVVFGDVWFGGFFLTLRETSSEFTSENMPGPIRKLIIFQTWICRGKLLVLQRVTVEYTLGSKDSTLLWRWLENHHVLTGHTVDGRIPAPLVMYETL